MCMHVVHVYGRNACVYRCVPIYVLIHMIQLSKISDLRILKICIMYMDVQTDAFYLCTKKVFLFLFMKSVSGLVLIYSNYLLKAIFLF